MSTPIAIVIGQTYRTASVTMGNAGMYFVVERFVETHPKFGDLYEGHVLPEGDNEKAMDQSLNPWRFYASELDEYHRGTCLNCKQPAAFGYAQCEAHLVAHRRAEREGMRRRKHYVNEVQCRTCGGLGHNSQSHLVGEP